MARIPRTCIRNTFLFILGASFVVMKSNLNIVTSVHRHPEDARLSAKQPEVFVRHPSWLINITTSRDRTLPDNRHDEFARHREGHYNVTIHQNTTTVIEQRNAKNRNNSVNGDSKMSKVEHLQSTSVNRETYIESHNNSVMGRIAVSGTSHVFHDRTGHSVSGSGTPKPSIPRTFKMRSTDPRNIITDRNYFSNRCRSRMYGNLNGWPTASVIITFCDNEVLYDILHTVHSIITRSPPQILHQIILVDDNTTKHELKTPLDDYCASVFGKLVSIHRSDVTLGLIQARLLGSRLATGDVIIMLDAHVEVQDKWLEAVLYEMRKNKQTMATMTLDWMNPTSTGVYEYRFGPGAWVCYFDWQLVFGFTWPSSELMRQHEADPTQALPSACSVGNWAMSRDFYWQIGGLDDGMDGWGGENMEMAIRTWLYGGLVVQVPCSHVGHMEREHQRDYRQGHAWTSHKLHNYARLVHVWFDRYDRYVYRQYPQLKSVAPGDLSHMLRVKHGAIHDFHWYLEQVYPQLGLYDTQTWAHGQLHNLGNYGCVLDERMYRVGYGICVNTTTVFLSDSGVLRSSAMVLSPLELTNGSQLIYAEAVALLASDDIAHWIHWQNGPLNVYGTNLCLKFTYHTNQLHLANCDPCDVTQRWKWDTYTREYYHSLDIPDVSQEGWRRGFIQTYSRFKSQFVC